MMNYIIKILTNIKQKVPSVNVDTAENLDYPGFPIPRKLYISGHFHFKKIINQKFLLYK